MRSLSFSRKQNFPEEIIFSDNMVRDFSWVKSACMDSVADADCMNSFLKDSAFFTSVYPAYCPRLFRQQKNMPARIRNLVIGIQINQFIQALHPVSFFPNAFQQSG